MDNVTLSSPWKVRRDIIWRDGNKAFTLKLKWSYAGWMFCSTNTWHRVMQRWGVKVIVKKIITSSEDEVMACLHYWCGFISWEMFTQHAPNVHRPVCTLQYLLCRENNTHISAITQNIQTLTPETLPVYSCTLCLYAVKLLLKSPSARCEISSSPATNYNCLFLESFMI